MKKLTRRQVIKKIEKGESLEGLDLSYIYLYEINMRNANLRWADLTGTNLSWADLSQANLSVANLSGANLSGANLSGANLREANLNNANLSVANLSVANLNWANLTGADLSVANLSGAYLSGAHLSGADLTGANLIWADLSQANLVGANLVGANLPRANLKGATLTGAYLNGAYLPGAYLTKAYLTGTYLASADFEEASLEKADISGANIYHLKTHRWKIESIKCTHIYQCPDKESWNDQKEREKYRRNFKPGEFEDLYHSFPKLELIFQDKYRDIDHRALLAVLAEINQQLPQANIRLRRLEQAVNNTTATIQAENKETIEKITELIPKGYQALFDKLNNIEKLLTNRNAVEQALLPLSLAQKQTMEWFIQNHQKPQAPSTAISDEGENISIFTGSAPGPTQIGHEQKITIQANQYIFSTPDEAEKVAQKIVAHLLSSGDIEKILTDLDQAVSPQLIDPKKRNWLIKAFQKHKPSIDKIAETLTTITTGAGGGILAEILKNL